MATLYLNLVLGMLLFGIGFGILGVLDLLFFTNMPIVTNPNNKNLIEFYHSMNCSVCNQSFLDSFDGLVEKTFHEIIHEVKQK